MVTTLHTPREAAVALYRIQSGWYMNIYVDRLNMWSLTDCVLGQTFVDYTEGLMEVYWAGHHSNAGLFSNEDWAPEWR